MTAHASLADSGAPPLAADLSPARRKLLVLVMMSGLMSMSIVFSSLPPALAALARFFGGGSSAQLTAQMMMVIPSFGLIAGGLLSGWLLRRTGVRMLLLGSLVAFGLFGGAPMVLRSVAGLLACRLLVGVAAASLSTACAALVVEALDAKERARILGWQAACGGGIGVAAIYLSGMLVERTGWPSTFAMYPIFAAVILLVALASVPATPPAAATQGARGRLADLKPVAGVLALTPVLFLVMGLANIQLPFLLQEHGIRSAMIQAVIVGMFMLGNMISSIAFAAIQRLVGNSRVLVVGSFSLGLGLLSAGLTHSALMAGLGAALMGVTMGLTSPFVWHAVMDKTPEQVRGLALGAVSPAMFLGSLVNPPVMSAFQHAFGLQATYTGFGVAVLLAAAAALLWQGRARTVASGVQGAAGDLPERS